MSTHIFFFGVNPQIWANNYDSNKIEELNLVGLTTTIRKGEFFVFLSHVTLLNNRIFFPIKIMEHLLVWSNAIFSFNHQYRIWKLKENTNNSLDYWLIKSCHYSIVESYIYMTGHEMRIIGVIIYKKSKFFFIIKLIK
jgi:hypothetical protein